MDAGATTQVDLVTKISRIDVAAVHELVLAAIEEVSPRTGDIEPNHDLVLDVGLDSFELVEVVLVIETELGVTLDLEDAMFEDVATVGDLSRRLTALLAEV